LLVCASFAIPGGIQNAWQVKETPLLAVHLRQEMSLILGRFSFTI